MEYLSFERKYNRPTLVTKKFVPTSNDKLLKWYELLNMREELFDRGCPAKIIEQYPIRYLLASSNRQSINSCGQKIFENQELKLIKIQR